MDFYHADIGGGGFSGFASCWGFEYGCAGEESEVGEGGRGVSYGSRKGSMENVNTFKLMKLRFTALQGWPVFGLTNA